MTMCGWKDMDSMMIYMRKAGIDTKDSIICLDGMQPMEFGRRKYMNLLVNKIILPDMATYVRMYL
jgi:hypothetical protein